MPACLAPWAPLALQGFLGGKGVKETQDSLAGLERRVTQALLVLKELQGPRENLVSQDHLATKEQRVTWLYPELKGTKEKEVLMGPLDSQGSRDHLAGMDVMEKEGIQDLPAIIKMQPQVIQGILDYQAAQAGQDLQVLQDWDFLVHQEGEVSQEFQATQE